MNGFFVAFRRERGLEESAASAWQLSWCTPAQCSLALWGVTGKLQLAPAGRALPARSRFHVSLTLEFATS